MAAALNQIYSISNIYNYDPATRHLDTQPPYTDNIVVDFIEKYKSKEYVSSTDTKTILDEMVRLRKSQNEIYPLCRDFDYIGSCTLLINELYEDTNNFENFRIYNQRKINLFDGANQFDCVWHSTTLGNRVIDNLQTKENDISIIFMNNACVRVFKKNILYSQFNTDLYNTTLNKYIKSFFNNYISPFKVNIDIFNNHIKIIIDQIDIQPIDSNIKIISKYYLFRQLINLFDAYIQFVTPTNITLPNFIQLFQQHLATNNIRYFDFFNNFATDPQTLNVITIIKEIYYTISISLYNYIFVFNDLNILSIINNYIQTYNQNFNITNPLAQQHINNINTHIQRIEYERKRIFTERDTIDRSGTTITGSLLQHLDPNLAIPEYQGFKLNFNLLQQYINVIGPFDYFHSAILFLYNDFINTISDTEITNFFNNPLSSNVCHKIHTFDKFSNCPINIMIRKRLDINPFLKIMKDTVFNDTNYYPIIEILPNVFIMVTSLPELTEGECDDRSLLLTAYFLRYTYKIPVTNLIIYSADNFNNPQHGHTQGIYDITNLEIGRPQNSIIPYTYLSVRIDINPSHANRTNYGDVIRNENYIGLVRIIQKLFIMTDNLVITYRPNYLNNYILFNINFDINNYLTYYKILLNKVFRLHSVLFTNHNSNDIKLIYNIFIIHLNSAITYYNQYNQQPYVFDTNGLFNYIQAQGKTEQDIDSDLYLLPFTPIVTGNEYTELTRQKMTPYTFYTIITNTDRENRFLISLGYNKKYLSHKEKYLKYKEKYVKLKELLIKN